MCESFSSMEDVEGDRNVVVRNVPLCSISSQTLIKKMVKSLGFTIHNNTISSIFVIKVAHGNVGSSIFTYSRIVIYDITKIFHFVCASSEYSNNSTIFIILLLKVLFLQHEKYHRNGVNVINYFKFDSFRRTHKQQIDIQFCNSSRLKNWQTIIRSSKLIRYRGGCWLNLIIQSATPITSTVSDIPSNLHYRTINNYYKLRIECETTDPLLRR